MVGQDTEDAFRKEVDRLNEALRIVQAERRDVGQANAQLHADLERMRAIADENLRRERAVKHELEEFRTKVREVAIRVAEEMDWCNDGLNEVLEELGLPKLVTQWRVTVEVIVVDQSDEDEARDVVHDLLWSASDNIYDFDITDVEEND